MSTAVCYLDPARTRPNLTIVANALTEGAAGAPPQPSTSGTVALGHTECDVVRGIGAPDNVGLSNNPRGDRVAVVTWKLRDSPRRLIW